MSDSPDFHPTDVIEDADGSLLVVDTGAWYKLCCPTSQLAKPDVLGAIYRVRRRGASPPADPRGRSLKWGAMPPDRLASLLDDGRPAVQARAIHEIARLGTDALTALERAVGTSTSVEARRNAVWALTRIEGAEARRIVRSALTDREERVQLAALHSAGLWRDRVAYAHLAQALASKRPLLQRAAAEGLGRLGDARAVPVLLSTAALPLDRVGEHAVTYALIEIGDASATAAGLKDASSRTQRTALIALDQMQGGALTPETVIPLLTGSDRLLQETAWWMAGRHPGWGGALARFFEDRLSALRPKDSSQDLVDKLAQLGTNASIQELLARTVEHGSSNDARLAALGAMAKTRVKELPAAWPPVIARALADHQPDIVRQAVLVARAAPASKETAPVLRDALLGVGRNPARPAALRLEALAAIDGGLTAVEPPLFDLLRDALEPSQPASVRVTAAGVIEKARLDRDQLWTLTGILKGSGPLELPRLLIAFDHGTDEKLGLEMLEALQQSKGRASIRPDLLRPRLAHYTDAVRTRGELLLASLNEDHTRQARRLEELLATIRGGDLRRGQLVFNGPKGACSSCHAIGYQGGRIGPDLTSIGQIRSERDLLEAIVYPNASLARGYESVVVTTTSGEVHGGVLRGDLPDEVVLVSQDGQETRIPRPRIADIQPGTVSLMPSGLGDQLTVQELADLLAFLKATRWGAD